MRAQAGRIADDGLFVDTMSGTVPGIDDGTVNVWSTTWTAICAPHGRSGAEFPLSRMLCPEVSTWM